LHIWYTVCYKQSKGNNSCTFASVITKCTLKLWILILKTLLWASSEFYGKTPATCWIVPTSSYSTVPKPLDDVNSPTVMRRHERMKSKKDALIKMMMCITQWHCDSYLWRTQELIVWVVSAWDLLNFATFLSECTHYGNLFRTKQRASPFGFH
jgi:hypothetical protein